MRNVATAIETALVDQPNATSITGSTTDGEVTVTIRTGESAPASSETIQLSDGVTITVSGNANGYTISGSHSNGSSHVSGSPLEYKSAEGGMAG